VVDRAHHTPSGPRIKQDDARAASVAAGVRCALMARFHAVPGADRRMADLTSDRRAGVVGSGASTGDVVLFEQR